MKQLKSENDELKIENFHMSNELDTLKELVCLDHPDAEVCTKWPCRLRTTAEQASKAKKPQKKASHRLKHFQN